MKLLSWNVNGLRAALKKGFLEFVELHAPDILCLQETKMQAGQAQIDLPDYHEYWNSAVRKGYSGVAVFTKCAPVSVAYGIGVDAHDLEGRVLTLTYPEFTLVNCYTPNSQPELKRLAYRMEWEDALRDYLVRLDRDKPLILCGDLNVAHEEIDIKNPRTNRMSAGFTDEERGRMSTLLECGFVDTFRRLYPDRTGAYSWWSYRSNARANNTGWRIDYFIASERLMERVEDSFILPEVTGSDHCPVGLIMQEGGR